MDSTGLSVLITYHNEGALLTRCLESFKGQEVYEFIICDDASKNAPEPFIPRGMPAKVIRNETNLGPSLSRNRLLREAKGTIIHFHDADDWVMPNWSQAVVNAFKGGASVVFTEVSSYRKGALHCEKVVGFDLMGAMDPVDFAISHFLLVPSGTYRKELVVSIGGYSDLWQSEDYEFHVRLLAKASNCRFLDEALVGIDLRDESRSSRRVEVWTSTLKAITRLHATLPTRYHPSLSEMGFRVGQVLFELNSIDEARLAFQFAWRIGRPKMEGRHPIFRMIARLNPLVAERVGRWYRLAKGA